MLFRCSLLLKNEVHKLPALLVVCLPYFIRQDLHQGLVWLTLVLSSWVLPFFLCPSLVLPCLVLSCLALSCLAFPSCHSLSGQDLCLKTHQLTHLRSSSSSSLDLSLVLFTSCWLHLLSVWVSGELIFHQNFSNLNTFLSCVSGNNRKLIVASEQLAWLEPCLLLRNPLAFFLLLLLHHHRHHLHPLQSLQAITLQQPRWPHPHPLRRPYLTLVHTHTIIPTPSPPQDCM